MELFLPAKLTILIVDDTPDNLSLLASLMVPSYIIKALNHGRRVLELATQEQPDLILLDVVMPDIDGYEICRQLKANPSTAHIPVIFLTSQNDIEDEAMGMSLGAVDYITRPIIPQILLSRVKAHLQAAAFARTMRVNNEYLEYEVTERTREMSALQQVAILALASLAEVRDVETGNHLRRTQNYMRALAKKLCHHPRFSNYLNTQMIDMLFKCAPLHDIGKVGIPDRILLKPGRYEPHEFEIMKTHPQLGHDALMQAQEASVTSFEFIQVAIEIVYCHHEKWDGTGYPQGLVGDAIPIPARLMALADVYDALISRRVYKDGMDHAQAQAIIINGRGIHFDPDVVDAFLVLGDEFQAIAVRYADGEEELKKKGIRLANVLSD